MDKMKKLLEYVSKNIPYYIEYFAHNNKDPLQIDSYPILSRKDYVDNYDMMISPECTKMQLRLSTTSGTTGIPLKVIRTDKEYYSQLMPLWRIRKKYYQIMPSSTCLRFCLTKEESKQVKNGINLDKDNKLIVSLFDVENKINAENIFKAINEKKPEYIKSTPTAICNFITFCKNNGIDSCEYIRYIESHSEYLFDFQREMMVDFFCNAQISNEYGCTEIMGIAQEIPTCKGLQVLNDNAYVEICNNTKLTREVNIEGDLVITGLNSFSMPFIRYKIGDRGKILQCEDNNSQFIEVMAGRTNDYIIYADGKKEHSIALARAIRSCNDINNQIIKFKFIQNSVNSIDLFLTIKDIRFSKEVEQIFRTCVSKTSLKSFQWNVFFVPFDHFTQKKSKFSYFENKII